MGDKGGGREEVEEGRTGERRKGREEGEKGKEEGGKKEREEGGRDTYCRTISNLPPDLNFAFACKLSFELILFNLHVSI